MSNRSGAVNKWLCVIMCAALLAGNSLLEWMVDSDLGIGWPHNAIRNWEQFGIGTLGGKIAINPGGYALPEKPEIYPGHRPMTLYPAWMFARVFGWTGSPTLPFHFAFSALILFCAWRLLGRDRFAFATGAVAILSPGFVVWPKILDPNTTVALLAIPYALFMAAQLRRKDFGVAHAVSVGVVTLLFTALNWTTILAHGQIFAFLVALRAPWRRLGVYLGAGFIAGLMVVIISVKSKSGGDTGSGKLAELLAGYTWGNGGYSNGSSTAVLVVRYAFTNALALFPLWLGFAWQWVKTSRVDRSKALLALLPIGMAFATTLGMRNYFCHHPWMAAPFLLVGLLCSFAVLRDGVVKNAAAAESSSPAGRAPWLMPATAVGAAFCFSLLVLAFYRERNSQTHPLVVMLRSHTPRSEPIAVSRKTDPDFADDLLRSREALDRYLIPVDEAPDSGHPAAARTYLSSAPMTGDWQLIGQASGQPKEFIPYAAAALEWFGKTIARRKAGDRSLDGAKTFYLYRIPPSAVAASFNHSAPPAALK